MARPRRRPTTTPAPTGEVDPGLPALGSAEFRDLTLAARGAIGTAEHADPVGDLARRLVGLPVPGPRDGSDLAHHAAHPALLHLTAAMSARSVLDARWYVDHFAPAEPR